MAVIVIAVVGALLLTAIVITAVAYHIIKRARRRALRSIEERLNAITSTSRAIQSSHEVQEESDSYILIQSPVHQAESIWCLMTSLSAGDKQHLFPSRVLHDSKHSLKPLFLIEFWHVFKSCYTVMLTYIHGHFEVIYNNNQYRVAVYKFVDVVGWCVTESINQLFKAPSIRKKPFCCPGSKQGWLPVSIWVQPTTKFKMKRLN